MPGTTLAEVAAATEDGCKAKAQSGGATAGRRERVRRIPGRAWALPVCP
jgi:hypothetical protein